MIENWIEPQKCTGCGACANVCPANAIKMDCDKEGFLHPVISENCIDCGKCKKVCNGRTKFQFKLDEAAYAAKNMNEDDRFTSTSGGVFIELAKYVINNSGVVAGALFSDQYHVVHALVDNKNDLELLKKSKYLQSDSLYVYKQIRDILKKDEDRYVLFAGTPCQVAGLKAFLNNDYKNLICMDFICHGVASPKVYQKWILEIEKQYSAKVSNVWFKYKDKGWMDSPLCTKISFEDGKEIIYRGESNHYMEGYIRYDFFTRDSCFQCEFKGKNRFSDLTLADFWDISEKENDNKGTSLVIINTEKGKRFWNYLFDKLDVYSLPIDEYVNRNRILNSSTKKNSYKKLFFLIFNVCGFERAYFITHNMSDFTNKVAYYRVEIKKYIIRKLKCTFNTR